MTLSARVFAFFVLALAVPLTGHTATFRVNFGADFPDKNPGDGVCDAGLDIGFPSCTLRAAIDEGNKLEGGPHRIIVPGGNFFLRLGRLEITTSLIIKGVGPRNPTIIHGFSVIKGVITRSPVFLISNPGTKARISNVTIRDGDNSNFDIFRDGSGISISEGAFLLLANSIVSDNSTSTSPAPAIVNSGFLTLLRSTVRNTQGSGIANNAKATLKVIESTISNNETRGIGGGIFNQDGRVDILNSTISGNEATAGAGILNDGTGILNDGIMNISFSTIAFNKTIISDNGGGGGIFNRGVVNIGNTILACNDDSNGPSAFGGGPPSVGGSFSPDCNGHFNSLRGNVVGLVNKNCGGFFKQGDRQGDQFGLPINGEIGIGTPMDSLDPMLEPLAFVTSLAPTQTHYLRQLSPARDNGIGGNPPHSLRAVHLSIRTTLFDLNRPRGSLPVTLERLKLLLLSDSSDSRFRAFSDLNAQCQELWITLRSFCQGALANISPWINAQERGAPLYARLAAAENLRWTGSARSGTTRTRT